MTWKMDRGGDPDMQGLTDHELRELLTRARAEWARRVNAAFYLQRGYDIEPGLVADAMLQRGYGGSGRSGTP
jgi:hypothetical protein